MKRWFYLLPLLFVLPLFSVAGGPDSTISCHLSNAPFDQFANLIFQKSGVHIFYQDRWVEGVTVTINSDSIRVMNAVERAIQATNLKVSRWNSDLVILPNEQLPTRLPKFQNRVVASDSTTTKKALTKSEEQYLSGRRADAMQVLKVGKKLGLAKGSRATIRGRILDQATGDPVVGATMYLDELKTGKATDINGYLNMVVPTGTYLAVFAFMGMETKRYSLEVYSDGDFIVELKRSAIEMEEVVVLGDKQMSMRLKDPGLEKISAKEIKEIPTMIGERDILRVSEMLPGIVTVGEGSAGVNVRGGNFDQNAFFMNKIPIYNTSHLFGFFPAFNADIVKDFSIYKGYIPANYGGQLSSVFNILGRQGNRKHFNARGSISPVAVGLTVEGPLKKDTCSFFLSGRYLYSDWILGKIDDPMIRTSQAGFNDIAAGFNYDFKKSQLSVFVYHSYDEFKLSDLNRYHYSTNGAAINLSWFMSKTTRGELSLTGSRYAFGTIDQQEPTLAYQHSYLFDDFRINTDFSTDLFLGNSLQYGLGITYYGLDRGSVTPYGETSLRVPINLGKEQAFMSSVYISDEWGLLPWLDVNAGVRFGLYTPVGPQTVYTYYPGAPMDPRYINDTLQFKNGEVIKWDPELDFRINLNMRTDEHGNVKVAYNRLHQNLFMLNNTIALSPDYQWKLADYHIAPAYSDQVSAGVYRTLKKLGLEASIEFYFKRTMNYPEFVDGADFLSNPLIETEVLPGKQNSYGMELMVRRSGTKLEGWISYTLSKTEVQVNGPYAWQQINHGMPYPANYDIPNVLNTVVNYHFSRRITTSGVVTYQTGRPVTYPASIYYINGIPYVDYTQRNAYRIPDYFRLDLSLTFEGNLRRNKLMHLSYIFSVYNVTGRDNPYSVYFTLENGKIKSYQYSVIAVPIPTFTILLKLGNYATD